MAGSSKLMKGRVDAPRTLPQLEACAHSLVSDRVKVVSLAGLGVENIFTSSDLVVCFGDYC